MKLSDPKDCLYCANNQTLNNLMIEIAPLSVSRLSFSRNKPIMAVAWLHTKIMYMT